MARVLGFLLFALSSTLFAAGYEIGSINSDLPKPSRLPPTVAAAADGSGFLSAWIEYRYSYSLLCVATVDPKGNRGPAVLVTKAGVADFPQAFPAGDGYAVIYLDYDRWRLVTLTARGEVRGPIVDLGPRGYTTYPRSASNGRRVVLIFQSAPNRVELTVFDVATRSVNWRTAVFPRNVSVWGEVTFAGDRLMVTAFSEGVYFVSVDDGAVSTFRDTTNPDVVDAARAPVGDNVLVAYGTGTMTIELQSAKGTVHASERIPLNIVSDVEPYKLVRAGANFLLLLRNSYLLYGMLVTPDGHAVTEPRLLSVSYGLVVAGGGDHALLVHQDNGGVFAGLIQSLELTDGIRVVHEEKPTLGFTGQRDISLASDGAGFLALFQEGSYTLTATMGADGVPRGGVKAVSTATGFLGPQQLAAGGAIYLQAFYSGNAVGLRRLASDGQSLGTTVVAAPEITSMPKIASDGKDFLVVWHASRSEPIGDKVVLVRSDRILGMIVHPDGTAGPVRTLVGPVPSGSVFVESVACDGARYALVYTFAQGNTLTWDLSVMPVSLNGEPGTSLPLFPADTTTVSIAGNGRDFLIAATDGQRLFTQKVLLDGAAFRLGVRNEIFRGFDSIAPSVAWNGTSYAVIWRYVTPQGLSASPASLSFLAMTHVHGEIVDPVTFLGTGEAASGIMEQPALAVNAQGTEVVVVDELRRVGDWPRAVAYTAGEIRGQAFIPAAPVAISARSLSNSETVSWIDTSSDERGFKIIGHPNVGRDVVVYAPPAATSATLPPAVLPMTIEIRSFNEAGLSLSSAVTLLPANRLPGRR